jgi:hypothetical protein
MMCITAQISHVTQNISNKERGFVVCLLAINVSLIGQGHVKLDEALC